MDIRKRQLSRDFEMKNIVKQKMKIYFGKMLQTQTSID